MLCHEKSSSAVKSYRDDNSGTRRDQREREREKKKLDSVVVVVRGIMRCK